VRVPTIKKGKTSSTRVEYRAPDAACNPYLAFSVLLAAGLAGIENNYELPPEVMGNVFEMTASERAAIGIERLPATLSHAIDDMERSELVAEALGEHVFGWFLRNKRAEWDRFQHHVSRFELENYLPIL
jgi:glutamine synthetase